MRAHTLRWTRLLQLFTVSEPFYLVAKSEEKIVGILPSLMKKNTKHGNVLNSLPFFGTHGGPVVLPELNERERLEVKEKLLLSFKELAEENNCVFSTIITTPFESDPDFIQKALKPNFIDPRITQMTVFPEKVADVENEIMFNTIEKRCRTAIRKAQKNDIKVEFAQDLSHLGELFEMHKVGMERKHGVYKPPRFFEILFDAFYGSQNKDYKILFAWKDNEIIGSLLLLYYKNIVDYFTPCFKLEYSSLQPVALLIYEAMKDSLNNGYTIWNFGGTRKALEGVYMFKRSWGAKDYPYQLLINAYGDTSGIRNLQEEEILSEYEWFYVLPFTELRKETE